MWKKLIILLFIAALTGCNKSPSQSAEQPSGAPAQKITVAYTYPVSANA